MIGGSSVVIVFFPFQQPAKQLGHKNQQDAGYKPIRGKEIKRPFPRERFMLVDEDINDQQAGQRNVETDQESFNVPGVVLEGFGCVFNAGSITNYNDMNAFFALVQTYQPYYVDRWEDSVLFPVLFAQNTSDVSWTKGPEGIIFDSFRLDMEECK